MREIAGVICFPRASASEAKGKGLLELESRARATPIRGLGFGVTGPSLPYRLDSTLNWDKDGEYSRAGHL